LVLVATTSYWYLRASKCHPHRMTLATQFQGLSDWLMMEALNF
jgi:hypothetical protein